MISPLDVSLRPQILVTGGNGQVGWELQRTLPLLGQVVIPGREALDLARPDSLRKVVEQINPRWIVNAAAYTAVDKAEAEPELAYAVNADAPRVLAETAAAIGATLIHYSTDYVFDGSGDQPFDEEATLNPLNVYGASKAAGEIAIRESGARHLIFRTSWVYGARGTNFLLTMRRLMREGCDVRPELRIVADQIGAPTWSRHIAEATALVMGAIASPSRGADKPMPWGTYHLTNAGETSWFDFAEAILSGMNIERPPKRVPIPSCDYPTPARRPLNSRLSNAKLERVFGLRLPDWGDALKQVNAVL